ncbi:MAG TPA: glutathione peroxidase [Kofleriaceae bacterium]|nr:glutathione peroxidase [Kofleriaceae bacterium]
MTHSLASLARTSWRPAVGGIALLAVMSCSNETKSAKVAASGPGTVAVAPAPPAVSPPAPGTEAAPALTTGTATKDTSMFTIPLKTLSGKPTSLAAFDGKALLLVNVASKCGLTPQYATLEALQDEYAAKGFTVVGFPCNQFGGQEPGSPEQIAEFCSATYGVTFPMMEKVEVNGAGRHPIYKELTGLADGAGYKGDIRWNFEKFVVSADRKTITRFKPQTTPDDPAVIAAIKAALPK